MALLAVFFLVAHSLEACEAHLGIPALPPTAIVTVAHDGAQCSARPGAACLCAHCACVPLPLDEHHGDGCEATSELSTAAQSPGFQLDAPLISLPVFATALDTPAVSTPLAAFLDGDGPPPARLRSQFLLSPLPGRAPPVLA